MRYWHINCCRRIEIKNENKQQISGSKMNMIYRIDLDF
jgi:hypothetical protein